MAQLPRYRVKAGSSPALISGAPVVQASSAPLGFGIPGGGTDGLEAGAGVRRLRSFRPGPAHVNTLIAASGQTVTQRARWLARNNAYAVNATDWWGNTVIGHGISPSWTRAPDMKKALRQAWDDWTDEADAEGLTDFYGMQRRAARELFIAGEVFIRLRYRRPEDGLLVPLQLQMLPAEMLDPTLSQRLPSGNAVRQGVEFDLIGRRVAYWFFRNHPADSTEPMGILSNRVRVPAEEVIHLLDPIEAGQIRGLSRFSNSVVKLFTLDQYDDAELERKKTAALYAGFITRPDLSEDQDLVAPLDDAGLLTQGLDGGGIVAGLEAGTMQILGPGEDLKFSQPADVGGNYEAFQYRNLLGVAAGLGVPYFALTGDMTKASFSSTRAAGIDARKRVEAFQWSVMIFLMCRPVLRAWVTQAALARSVPGLTEATLRADPRGISSVRWMPPPWASADPEKDAKTNALLVENRFMARSDVIEAQGFDAEETDERIALDQERERRLGIMPPAAKPASAPPPEPVDPLEDDPAAPAPPEE